MGVVVQPRVTARQTLAVDFDGVIHAYRHGWREGACYDDPTEGCADALKQLDKRYKLVVFTARHNLEDVHLWLVLHGLRHLFSDITNRKPQAVAYLDDRAVRFLDWGSALEALL